MRVANTLVLNEKRPLQEQIRDLQTQIDKLFTCLQGRVSFGTGVDGVDGQNIAGQFQLITTSATPDAENTVAHTIGSIPTGYIVIYQDKAASLYGTPTLGTAWTSSNVYVKCNVASTTFLIFLVKKGT